MYLRKVKKFVFMPPPRQILQIGDGKIEREQKKFIKPKKKKFPGSLCLMRALKVCF